MDTCGRFRYPMPTLLALSTKNPQYRTHFVGIRSDAMGASTRMSTKLDILKVEDCPRLE